MNSLSVSLIKEGCFSKTLKVTQQETNIFSYQTFTVEETNSNAQSVTCSIKVCQGIDCHKNTNSGIICDGNSPYQWYKPQIPSS